MWSLPPTAVLLPALIPIYLYIENKIQSLLTYPVRIHWNCWSLFTRLFKVIILPQSLFWFSKKQSSNSNISQPWKRICQARPTWLISRRVVPSWEFCSSHIDVMFLDLVPGGGGASGAEPSAGGGGKQHPKCGFGGGERGQTCRQNRSLPGEWKVALAASSMLLLFSSSGTTSGGAWGVVMTCQRLNHPLTSQFCQLSYLCALPGPLEIFILFFTEM